MLAAIMKTTLNDDVYEEDLTTRSFERQIASLCGHEAAAFVITGTMANQLALRTLLTQPPHAILADAHAHIIHWEAGGTSNLTGAFVQAIRPRNGMYLTVEDVRRHAIVIDDVHKCPTRVISLEQTTSGLIIPLEELQRISTWAKSKDILVHIDGARLWEAVAAGAGSIKDFAQCCDLLTLDFSKNLGAPMGAMVVGSARHIKKLRHVRKSIGGGMRQAGVLAAAARQAILENFGDDVWDSKGVLEKSQKLAKLIASIWIRMGGQLLKEVQTNMIWVNLENARCDVKEWNETGSRHGIKLDGKRIVIHHQICDEAVERLGMVFEDVLKRKTLDNSFEAHPKL